jgi:hypothetical protein
MRKAAAVKGVEDFLDRGSGRLDVGIYRIQPQSSRQHVIGIQGTFVKDRVDDVYARSTRVFGHRSQCRCGIGQECGEGSHPLGFGSIAHHQRIVVEESGGTLG